MKETPYTYEEKTTLFNRFRSIDGSRIYATMLDGSIRRLSPSRPWRGKSERRRVLKAWREDRALAADNLATP